MLRYPVMCFFNRSLGRKLSILNTCCKFLIWLALEFSRSICGFLWVLSALCWGGDSVYMWWLWTGPWKAATETSRSILWWSLAPSLGICTDVKWLSQKKKKSETFRCWKLYKLCKYSDVSYKNKKMPPCGKKDALVYQWTFWVSRQGFLNSFLSNSLANKIKFCVEKCMAKLPLCHVCPSLCVLRVFTGVLKLRLHYFQLCIPVSFPSCLLLPQSLGLGGGTPFPWAQLWGLSLFLLVVVLGFIVWPGWGSKVLSLFSTQHFEQLWFDLWPNWKNMEK